MLQQGDAAVVAEFIFRNHWQYQIALFLHITQTELDSRVT